jgi:hypothetical protein
VRAVISEDKDGKALLDRLKLESFEKSLGGYGIEANEAWSYIPESTREEIIRRLHGRFHSVVCTWLQDQGFKVT